MTPTATHSTTKFPVLLLAISIVLLATGTGTAVDGKDLDGGCIRRVAETETPVPGSCLCFERCARGRDKPRLRDAESQTCFVDCVLTHGVFWCRRAGETETPVPSSCLCYERCAGGGDKPGLRDAKSETCFVDCVLTHGVFCPAGEDPVAPSSPAASLPPVPVPVPDVVLTERVRVTVSRPKASRSRKEKDDMEEVLVIEIVVAPDVSAIEGVIVHLNSPVGGEEESRAFDRANPRYLDTIAEFIPPDEAGKRLGVKMVYKYPVTGKLETIGADGDEKIVVSLVPNVFKDNVRPYWYEKNKFIITVSIAYEPKQLYLDSSLNERS